MSLAEQVEQLVDEAARYGLLLKRTSDSIKQALENGDGYPHIVDDEVVAYAESAEKEHFHILRSVVASSKYGKSGYGTIVVKNRLTKCFDQNKDKEVYIVCSELLADWYARFGFKAAPKESAPESIRGGRSGKDWQHCDRIFMTCKYADFEERNDG